MSPSDPRAIGNSLNDERDTGGQSKLATLRGWHHSTVGRKLNGESPITESDALANQKAVEISKMREIARMRFAANGSAC
jgi:hypothetical protein